MIEYITVLVLILIQVFFPELGNAVFLLNFTITQHSLIYSMYISLLLPGEVGNAVCLLNSTITQHSLPTR